MLEHGGELRLVFFNNKIKEIFSKIGLYKEGVKLKDLIELPLFRRDQEHSPLMSLLTLASNRLSD